jgi:transcriptional regulator with XRE-family HTH domain
MHTEKLETIADRCRYARKRLGLTQKQLADEAQVSKGTIGNVESGRNETVRALVQIARVLQVTPAWLGTGDDNAPITLELDPKEVDLVLEWRRADQQTRDLIDSAFAVGRRRLSAPKLRRA